MKKEYTQIETTIIELRAEQALLVGSFMEILRY